MALNPLNVHSGPARMFLNVTNPATGNPPTSAAHTAGVPTPGTEVGYTEGETTFRKVKTTGEINAEQALGPISTYLETETAEVVFTAMERVFATLQAAFDNTAGAADEAARMIFWGGGLQYPLRTQSVMTTSQRPNQVSKWEIGVLYRAYSVGGFETTYRKNGASTFAVTLRGLYDGTRTLGDQLFQFVIEE